MRLIDGDELYQKVVGYNGGAVDKTVAKRLIDQMPTIDAVSRQAAIDGFYEMASDMDHLCTVSDYVSFLESLPSAEPERKKGKWIKKEKIYPELPEDSDYRFECSLCGWSDQHNDKMVVPYCWHCGAEMSE